MLINKLVMRLVVQEIEVVEFGFHASLLQTILQSDKINLK